MPAYILKRLVAVVPVLFGLSIIVFLVMALIPGDTATAILGAYATPENVERINRDLGLDQPLVQQYLVWIGNVLQGDFGRSYALNRPVLDEVLERFGATLILAGVSLVLCTVIGLLAGVVSAVRQFGWADRAITFFVLAGISMPSFSSTSSRSSGACCRPRACMPSTGEGTSRTFSSIWCCRPSRCRSSRQA